MGTFTNINFTFCLAFSCYWWGRKGWEYKRQTDMLTGTCLFHCHVFCFIFWHYAMVGNHINVHEQCIALSRNDFKFLIPNDRTSQWNNVLDYCLDTKPHSQLKNKWIILVVACASRCCKDACNEILIAVWLSHARVPGEILHSAILIQVHGTSSLR